MPIINFIPIFVEQKNEADEEKNKDDIKVEKSYALSVWQKNLEALFWLQTFPPKLQTFKTSKDF